MQENLRLILKLATNNEGGYVNHPKDPGGPTNHGITQATLSTALGRPASISDVKALTVEASSLIYSKMYFRPVGGHVLPPGLDYAMVDFGINSGPARAVKTLQSLLPGVAIDGFFGAKTLRAVQAIDTDELIRKLCEARLAFYKKLKTWKTFGRGWTYRIIGKDPLGKLVPKRGVLGDALDMFNKGLRDITPPRVDVAALPAQGKARDESVKLLAPLRNKLQAIGIGSAGVSAMVQAAGNYVPSIQNFAATIEPYKDDIKWLGVAFTFATVLAAVGVLALNIDKIRETGTHA